MDNFILIELNLSDSQCLLVCPELIELSVYVVDNYLGVYH